MLNRFPRRWLLGFVLVGLSVAGLAWYAVPAKEARAAEAVGPDKAAVQRAEELVKMLDDLHKGYVVNITATYVKAQERTPAAHVAKNVFAYMEKNGWAPVRLIDTTGVPANKANVAKSDFEKRAVAKLNGGEKYVSEVAKKDDQYVLRAATQVPVVMEQCLNCHISYKKGDLIGALIYEVPIK
jgi:hypothetical protein